MTRVAKKAAKKTRTKKSAKSSKAKGPVNLEQLREKVRQLVAAKLEPMTNAATEEAEKGHIPQLKYLFEVIGLYPPAPGGSSEHPDSDDLARTLLDKFQFPHASPPEEDGENAGGAASEGDSVTSETDSVK